MARIRTIKPEFCSSADTGELDREGRLFFLQLFLEADDSGRMLWIPRKLCGVLYPHDDDVNSAMLTGWAAQCARRGMLEVYEIAGVQYLQISNWSKHQKISNPTASRLPPPENAAVFILSGNAPEVLQNISGDTTETLRSDLGPRKGNRNREGEREQGISPTAQGTPSASPSVLTLAIDNTKPATKEKGSAEDRIVELVLRQYHEFLPACRKVAVKNPKLRKKILAADKLASKTIHELGLKVERSRFWEAFFGECQDDPWLRGERENPNNPKWKQNLGVLLEEERFAEITNRAIARPADEAEDAA